jgi:DNA polymerase II small subunit/DNA polymerase delta subunit B
MSSIEIKELIITALNEGFQIHPDLVKVLEDQPELIPRVIEVIRKKKEYDPNNFTITLKDIESFGLNLEIDKTNLIINSERSLSDGIQVSTYEELNIMLNDRLKKMKELWLKRPNKIPLFNINYIKSKGKDETWAFALILQKISNDDYKILADDGKGVFKLKVFSKKIFDEIIPGSCVALKINPEDFSVTDFEDVEFPEVKRKKLKGKIALVSDLMIGSNKVEHLFDSLKAIKPDGIFFLGNLVDSLAYIKNGVSPLEGYKKLSEFLSTLPKRILKVIIPGHADFTGKALPQKPVSYKIAKDLYSTQNVRLLSNPSYLTIEGSSFLLYNAYYMFKTAGMTEEYAVKKLLKTRHLAPTVGSIPIVPSISDKLIIEDVPEHFFLGGGKEKIDLIYRGVWSVGVPSIKNCNCYAFLNLDKESTEWITVD